MDRIRIFLVALIAIAVPTGAFATPASVNVFPSNPTVADSISLETTLSWGTSGYWVFDSMTISTGPFERVIQIFVDSPAPDEVVLTIVTSEEHIADLGLLPAGNYSYTVNEFDVQRGTGLQMFAGSLSGSFTVVPEPSSLVLVLLGLSGLALRPSFVRHR
jgi:hypothetical protein